MGVKEMYVALPPRRLGGSAMLPICLVTADPVPQHLVGKYKPDNYWGKEVHEMGYRGPICDSRKEGRFESVQTVVLYACDACGAWTLDWVTASEKHVFPEGAGVDYRVSARSLKALGLCEVCGDAVLAGTLERREGRPHGRYIPVPCRTVAYELKAPLFDARRIIVTVTRLGSDPLRKPADRVRVDIPVSKARAISEAIKRWPKAERPTGTGGPHCSTRIEECSRPGWVAEIRTESYYGDPPTEADRAWEDGRSLYS